ncbi:MAG: hypothetical protein JWN56_2382 [Sphingobacteriales bacterium]|nr:hypothetical protein [Sphingobacteriales bacterium]
MNRRINCYNKNGLNETLVFLSQKFSMKKLIISFLLLTATGRFNAVLAQDISPDIYKSANIPDSLKLDANSVVRYSSDELIVKAVGKISHKHHSIITILNEKADDEAVLQIFYNRKFDDINKAEMVVYNREGKQIKKYKKSEMYDRSASSLEGLTDYRFIYAQHDIPSYPITIELIYEKTQSSYLDLGAWELMDPERSVQQSTYKVLINPALSFRYKNRNTSILPVTGKEGDLESYRWEIKNTKSYKPEEGVPVWRFASRIDFACNTFEFDGLEGNLESWKSYGDWYWNLNKEVCTLPLNRISEIKAMTDTIKTEKTKVKFLYEYMQKNTRYVSIQLGIGGLKPFPATFVDQKKYGDCKALSNYMYALLKAVNIRSNYAIINAKANMEPADPKFVNDPFDHIVLCVPLEKDTIWLECTSQTQAFGKLGSFTENRYALLISEDGGKLVKTPRSNMEDNQIQSEVNLTIMPNGSAVAKVEINASGEYRDTYDYVSGIKVDEQKQFFIGSLGLKQPSFFEIKHTKDREGIKEMELELEYEKFSDVMTGDKQFYKPAVFNICNITLPPAEKRVNDYYFEHPMKKYGKTTINLPEGYVVESMPSNVSLKFTYGNYEVKYSYDAVKNQVISEAKFNLVNHVIPAAKYSEMQTYFDNIAKANGKKLILKKKV